MSVSVAIDLFYATLPITKLAVLVACLAFILPDFSVGGVLKSHIRPTLPLGLVFIFAWFWLCFVSIHVPKPYLDEVFHIPQAQRYCEGRWFEWDDKITTPPGLYGISVLALRLAGILLGTTCSVFNLRSVNVWCATLIAFAAGLCRCQIELNQSQPRGPSRTKLVSSYPIHTGFNIALFPVLFFFSALYYTDVLSTLAVLVAYSNHLDRVSRPRNSVRSDILTLVLGIFALLMRQTNVFWVVVYMGGLEAVHAVKSVAAHLPKHRIADSLKTAVWHYFFNSSLGDIHDPPVSRVWPDDLLFTTVSVASGAVSNPLRVLKQIWPHITTLAAFSGFVALNGGVVLGDKSNHIATIHLAQMLYIWPLFGFFSAPLILPAAFSILQGTSSFVRRLFLGSPKTGYPHATGALRSEEPVFKRKKQNDVNSSKSKEVGDSFGAPSQYTVAYAPVLRLLILLVLIPITAGVAFAVVKYNTIIHPFTLADNRHYMFYIFRYTIRQPGLFRFYLIAPYLLSAGLVLGALTLGDRNPSAAAMSFFNHPFLQPPAEEGTAPSSPGPSGSKKETAVPNQRKEDAEAGAPAPAPANVPYLMKPHFDEVPSTSWTASLTTMLLLVLATSLSLITAPLVEPRYFIIPWIMWRLHIPAWSTKELPRALWRIPGVRQVLRLGRVVDLRLLLETTWFCAINYVTMRMFITRPFQWRAEDGTLLDEGRFQRFMW